MNLIDKQNVMGFQIGQHRRQITGLLKHRPRSGFEIHSHLIGKNISQRGFTKSGRAED